jgi:hypothetical protein
MIDVLLDTFYLALLFGIGFASGGVYAQFRSRQQTARDSVLMIKPPRQFFDEDGRSDFRPELRELAERRRQQREATR